MAYDSLADELYFGGSAGGGKMLALDTPIPGPFGFTPMGELDAGSLVLDEFKEPIRVVTTHPIDPSPDSYRVCFSNGDEIFACADHRWYTIEASKTPLPAGGIRTTKQIADTLMVHGRCNHVIPFFWSDDFCYITSCERVEPRPMRCITVDNPTGLYLAGRSMIPTHNTDLILGLALTYHRRSLILRRIASYLRGITDRLQEIMLGKKCRWRAIGYGGTMYLPSGESIELGGCEQERDRDNYQGIPHDGLFFDEISHFSSSMYKFIIAWSRSVNPEKRCRVVCAGNPPTTPEGRWVIEEWAPWLDRHCPNPALPGELRWYTTLKGKTVWLDTGEPFKEGTELIVPKSRTFIPSRLSDNPILAATGYGARLQALPEPLRSQLLYGDMNAGQEDHESQVIPTDWVRAAMDRWEEGPPEGFTLSCLGVDVARGGKDKTVISKRYHHWFARLVKHAGSSTPDGPEAAARVMAVYDGKADVNIDIIGIGSSAYDCLKATYGKLIHGINNAAASSFQDRSGLLRFVNMRAGSYWALREALDPSGPQQLALPPDDELLADLCSPRYKLTASGIIVEPKDDVIKRIGRSPDCGDAVTLSHIQVKKKEFWVR